MALDHRRDLGGAGRVDEARKAGRRLGEEHPAGVVRGRGVVEVGPQLGDPRLEIVVAAGLDV